MKLGDKLWCKSNNKQLFTVGRPYEIKWISNPPDGIREFYMILGDNNSWTIVSDDVSYFYIWDYFYSIDELRDLKLNDLDI